MRRVRVDDQGGLHCRKCGSGSLLARYQERNQASRRLKCADCGRRQRYRATQPART